MKPIREMTDEQLNETVAVEVMHDKKPELPNAYFGREYQGFWRLVPINGGGMAWIPVRFSKEMAYAWQITTHLTTTHRTFRLDYDKEYGADLRTGWSVSVDGVVVVQFAATAERAVCEAGLAVSRWEVSDGA